LLEFFIHVPEIAVAQRFSCWSLQIDRATGAAHVPLLANETPCHDCRHARIDYPDAH
jgi:hypothetical protein